MTLNIGPLDQEVVLTGFTAASPAQSALGEALGTFATSATVWASRRDDRGTEVDAAQGRAAGEQDAVEPGHPDHDAVRIGEVPVAAAAAFPLPVEYAVEDDGAVAHQLDEVAGASWYPWLSLFPSCLTI